MAIYQETTFNHRYLSTILHGNFQRTGITWKICRSRADNGTCWGCIILRRRIIPKTPFNRIEYCISFFHQNAG